MAWIPEVKVSGESGWHSNHLTFATEREAVAYARDLFNRWLACTEYRAFETDDIVITRRWDFETGTAISIE